MPVRSRFLSPRTALVAGALALPLAGCDGTAAEPVAPPAEAPAAVRAPATDAELAAWQIRAGGPGARTW